MRLGLADDVASADGAAVLDHEQAKEKARSWARAVIAGPKADPGAGLTVDTILDRYFAAREAEGMKSVADARARAAAHIRPALGALLATDLTAEGLRRWRDDLVKAPKRVRTRRFAAKQATRTVDLSDPEVLRQRRDTANRTLTVLKAALNWARTGQLVHDDTAWRLVKPFRGTTAARVRFLDAVEQGRLLAAAEGRLRDLVAAALVTGARFGELARLKVRDLDAANGSVFVAESKSGKPRHIPLPAGGAKLFAALARNKSADAFLLTQATGGPWKPASYQRGFQEALVKAELDSITLHALRHTYASTMVRAGAPLMVVAHALGHADTRMVEKHYAHLAPSYVAETIRRFAPDVAAV